MPYSVEERQCAKLPLVKIENKRTTIVHRESGNEINRNYVRVAIRVRVRGITSVARKKNFGTTRENKSDLQSACRVS
jgi:hypothetical protein